jgi:hypothetical protein
MSLHDAATELALHPIHKKEIVRAFARTCEISSAHNKALHDSILPSKFSHAILSIALLKGGEMLFKVGPKDTGEFEIPSLLALSRRIPDNVFTVGDFSFEMVLHVFRSKLKLFYALPESVEDYWNTKVDFPEMKCKSSKKRFTYFKDLEKDKVVTFIIDFWNPIRSCEKFAFQMHMPTVPTRSKLLTAKSDHPMFQDLTWSSKIRTVAMYLLLADGARNAGNYIITDLDAVKDRRLEAELEKMLTLGTMFGYIGIPIISQTDDHIKCCVLDVEEELLYCADSSGSIPTIDPDSNYVLDCIVSVLKPEFKPFLLNIVNKNLQKHDKIGQCMIWTMLFLEYFCVHEKTLEEFCVEFDNLSKDMQNEMLAYFFARMTADSNKFYDAAEKLVMPKAGAGVEDIDLENI